MKISEKNLLGSTGIEVSPLCFGSLTMTPFQSNLSLDEGAALLCSGYDRGIKFVDTAQLYENYHYLKKALNYIPRDDYTISTKTYAWNKKLAEEALVEALKSLDTDYIDIFLLHEQESEHTIKGHYEALKYLIGAKEKGYIRAIGLSTHRVSGVLGANKFKEIEVLHPILNKNGLGIADGSVEDMIAALIESKKLSKGIYSMKPLGGGHLIPEIEEAFRFIKGLDFIDSIAIGMQSTEEIDCNISLLEKGVYPEDLRASLGVKERKLIIEEYCIGCGNCVRRCRQNALSLVNNKASVDPKKCVLCGYCATVCEDFYIKVI